MEKIFLALYFYDFIFVVLTDDVKNRRFNARDILAPNLGLQLYLFLSKEVKTKCFKVVE